MKYIIKVEVFSDVEFINDFLKKHGMPVLNCEEGNFDSVIQEEYDDLSDEATIGIRMDFEDKTTGWDKLSNYDDYTDYQIMSFSEFKNNEDTLIMTKDQPVAIKKETDKLSFKMGADPEFAITFGNNVIPAVNIVKAILSHDNKMGQSGYNIKEFGNIGWDGASSTGEIRPSPSDNLDELVNNIGNLFRSFSERIKIFDISVLSRFFPVGGHIHFEVPINASRDWTKVNRIISSFYMPLFAGENVQNLRARINHSYGRMGDYRKEAKGSRSTIEFRLPSAEWTTTPTIAKSTLAYLATVYHEILFNPDNIKKFKELIITSDSQGNSLQDLTISKLSYFINTMNTEIKKAIKTFELYPKYEKEINFILNHKKVLKEKEKVNFNILEGWSLVDNKIPSIKNITNKKKTKEGMKNINIDDIQNIIRFPVSGDTNMDIFNKFLAERVISHNWRLKNNYCFFGVRKGIKEPIVFNNESMFYYGLESINSAEDATAVRNLAGRMIQKFKTRSSDNLSNNAKNKIIIGIPYEERIKENFKETIKLIYKLEKEETEPKILDISSFSLSVNEDDRRISDILNKAPDNDSLAATPRNTFVDNFANGIAPIESTF